MPDLFDKLKLTYQKQQVQSKAKVFNLYESYYLGSQYNQGFVKRYFRLFAQIREFYTIISRTIDNDVQLIPGGWKVTPPEMQPSVNAILEQSDWRVNGGLLVHYGALFGEFYLNVYGTPEEPRIQPLDPRGIWLDADKCVIVRDSVDENGNKYEFGQVITKDEVIIYKDTNEVERTAHGFGVVPVFYGQNKSVGKATGLNSFYHVLDEVNAVNETATFLQQLVMKNLAPQKLITGAAATNLEIGPDKTLFLPEGASFNAVELKLDIDATLKFIQDIYLNVKQALPELVFDSLRAPNLQRPNSSESLRLYALELIYKIRRLRLGYDGALRDAVNLAMGETGVDWEFDPDRPVLDLFPNQDNSTPEMGLAAVSEMADNQVE